MSTERAFTDLTFYETYYFANAIKNVLEDQFAYIRHLHDFYGDGRYLAYAPPFPRFSAFHNFISFVVDDMLDEDAKNIDLQKRQDTVVQFQGMESAFVWNEHPSRLPVNRALDRFGIQHQDFKAWLKQRSRTFLEADDNDVSEYYGELRLEGPFDDLLERTTGEVFFVLFQNRHALLLFNEMMASQMKSGAENDFVHPDYESFFDRPGVLRRVHFPSWVQRAVFFRDRGMCVICHKDLSGTVAIGSQENYDHIVPLASGGLNDITNIQLLCRECNAAKCAGKATTSTHYEAWYPLH